MRYIVFELISNGKTCVPRYYDPSTLISPHAFILAPGETVMILLDTNDSVYRFRGCCRTVHEMANEQICVAVRNVSRLAELIVVSRGTRLDELMNRSNVDHRLVYADMNELAAMAVRGSDEIIGDDVTLVLNNGNTTMGREWTHNEWSNQEGGWKGTMNNEVKK